VDTTKGPGPPAPPLLVRWADPAGQQDVVTLLRDVPLAPREVADLMRLRGVLVLSDVTLPPSAPPLAAAAFRRERRR